MNSNRRSNSNFKKRAPARSFTRKNDVYVTNKTDFRATLKKCEGILNSEESECFLHCIGNAINRGINLALKLSEEHNFKFEANTSTINLIGESEHVKSSIQVEQLVSSFPDDHHPLNDEDDFLVRKRMNSCLHIRVYRPFMIKPVTEEPEKLIKI